LLAIRTKPCIGIEDDLEDEADSFLRSSC